MESENESYAEPKLLPKSAIVQQKADELVQALYEAARAGEIDGGFYNYATNLIEDGVTSGLAYESEE